MRTVFFDVTTEQQVVPVGFSFGAYEFVVKNEAGEVVETLVNDTEDATTELDAGSYTVTVSLVGDGDDRRFAPITASFIVSPETPETIGVPVSVSISVI